MKPIEQARADLNAAEARSEHADFMRHAGVVLDVAVKLKKVMMAKGLGIAAAECPSCHVRGALHGRLITGPAAGRHRKSGGAFRMWCDTCPDIRMME